MTTYGLKGDRVRRLRIDMGMTQEDMVARLRALVDAVNQSHLSQVERGERGLTPETLGAVATVLETSADYLIGLTDDPLQHGSMDDQVIIVERDPVRREFLQHLFARIERMPAEHRNEYYRIMDVTLRGMSNTRPDPFRQ